MNMFRHLPIIAVCLFCLSVDAHPVFAQGCLTAGCHQPLTMHKHVHEPAAAGDCLACHEQMTPGHPSASGDSFTFSLPTAELCQQCHELEHKDRMHPPVAEGECLDCHDPHGSAEANLLKEPFPGLCYQCHAEIQDEAKSSTRHAAVYRPGSCGVCHSGHAADGTALLVTNEQELCLSCHGQDDYKRSRPLRNIGREIDGKPYLHGPLAEGECSPCHNPHGSPYYRLLRADYPEGVYASYSEENYALCFECHDTAMMSSKTASADTGFRTGSRNLHFLHLAGLRKGRVCTTCHASHASSSPKLIKDTGTSFGEWTIPVNFEATATGGSCAPGCHKAVEYDRSKP